MQNIRISSNALIYRDNSVLLIERAGTKFFPGHFGLVAGHMEHGEDPLQAALREVHEEVGYSSSDLDDLLHRFYTTRIYTEYTYIDFYFSVRLKTDMQPVLEVARIKSFTSAAADALPANTIGYIADVVRLMDGGSDMRSRTYWFEDPNQNVGRHQDHPR